MIIIRILFGIAAFLVAASIGICIATFLSKHDQKRSEARYRAAGWFVETILAAVFFTLWCIEKGII